MVASITVGRSQTTGAADLNKCAEIIDELSQIEPLHAKRARSLGSRPTLTGLVPLDIDTKLAGAGPRQGKHASLPRRLGYKRR
jgi:hypothetical protein